MIKITIDSKFHRCEYDDFIAGGKVEYNGKTFYWEAQHNCYGFGWEIEPITEEDWNDIPKDDINKIIKLIEKILNEHVTEYIF